MSFSKSYPFLIALKENNSREWFEANKSAYQSSQQEMKEFTHLLVDKMKAHDNVDEGATKIFRIFRDVRFSKDKTPYKTHLSGFLRRATSSLRGGYYFSIQPGQSYAGGGFFRPEPADLLHIRKHLDQDAEPLREVLDSEKFKQVFGELGGEKVKSAPKGFSKENPNIDLIRYKQFIVTHKFTDEEVQDALFPEKLNEVFRNMRPFFDVMSEILTTDLNGLPLSDQ